MSKKKPLIVFEGIEGSGKTTLINYISKYFQKNNIKFVRIREPGGNENSEIIRKIISELIAAKQIKVLLAKNETMLFSDPALDLTDDVTSMLDVAAAEATSQSD